MISENEYIKALEERPDLVKRPDLRTPGITVTTASSNRGSVRGYTPLDQEL